MNVLAYCAVKLHHGLVICESGVFGCVQKYSGCRTKAQATSSRHRNVHDRIADGPRRANKQASDAETLL